MGTTVVTPATVGRRSGADTPEQPYGRGIRAADDTMDWLGTTFPRGFYKGCLSNVADVSKKLYFT
jgi:hypothetical protein